LLLPLLRNDKQGWSVYQHIFNQKILNNMGYRMLAPEVDE
jgi:hypothetical protein